MSKNTKKVRSLLHFVSGGAGKGWQSARGQAGAQRKAEGRVEKPSSK
jgi:hypothetical protein